MGFSTQSAGPSGTSQFAERLQYQPRKELDTVGLSGVFGSITPWQSDTSIEEIAFAYERAIPQGLARLDQHLMTGEHSVVQVLLAKAGLFHSRGDTTSAYKTLDELESRIKGTELEAENLFTIIFYKGVTALRTGENENCLMCRGQSACIFPIASSAVHINPAGSRLAIEHFSEYLRQFPEDLEVRWLLNLAYMTLGEHPDKVDPRHRLVFDAFSKSEFDVGQFHDVSHLVGVNRLNQSGGAIMDDFDNDGLLDLVVTSWAPSEPMAFYHNTGDGTFEDRTTAVGLNNQLGGLYCVQADYNNDGRLDIFIPRGSWMPAYLAQRPSLLRNNEDGTFSDVTREAGLLAPVNSVSSAWADFDNDGFLDLFVCCQRQRCLLYRNKGDETFEDMASSAGLPAELGFVLGATWIDFDNDGYPDLFVNSSGGAPGPIGAVLPGGVPRLFRNNRNGTFTDVTKEMGIDGPQGGFSCWAFDFDNDGWLDLFAAAGGQPLDAVVKGLLGQSHGHWPTSKLYRNLGGKKFQDVAPETGLNQCCTPMGSNFGDIDNDGYLDFYLGTGAPNLSMLIPNRLFKNVAGKRFTEITASSRTGHLQKGHGVAFGDWDRNGTVDLFIELGGAVHGDRYHNVLFQNPGQGNNWLSVKLVGEKTNKAAIGARIKVVTAGEQPLTIQRHVTSGGSFGANPLEQHFGLGRADRVARLEIHWPTSDTTQVFHELNVNHGVVVNEFAENYQTRTLKSLAVPD